MKRLPGCPTLVLIAALAGSAAAQDIPKGFDLFAELGQGFARPPGGPTLYLGTLQVVPQWTVVPDRLRAGLVLGALYPGTAVGGLAGGRLTLKVLSGPGFMLAKSFHVNLQGEYLPVVRAGDGWRQWAGLGLGLESSNLLSLNFRVHRDFGQPATYGQMAVGFNLRFRRTLPPKEL